MKNLFITQAEWKDNYRIELTFNDGKTQTVDFETFIKNSRHPDINKYKDINLFRSFYLDDGNIIWDDNWDLIFPVINLYYNDLLTDYDS